MALSYWGQHGPTLIGKANEQTGFAASNFKIDWEKQQALCPQERKSVSWTPAKDGQRDVIKIKFASADCGACRSRKQCTHATQPRRTLTIRPQEEYLALQAARMREASEGFAKQYGVRAGIEGTMSQGVRAFGLRRARYFGKAKTHLQHVLIAGHQFSATGCLVRRKHPIPRSNAAISRSPPIWV